MVDLSELGLVLHLIVNSVGLIVFINTPLYYTLPYSRTFNLILLLKTLFFQFSETAFCKVTVLEPRLYCRHSLLAQNFL